MSVLHQQLHRLGRQRLVELVELLGVMMVRASWRPEGCIVFFFYSWFLCVFIVCVGWYAWIGVDDLV